MPEKNKSKTIIGVSKDKNSSDINQSNKESFFNLVQNVEGFHLNSLITKNISLFTKNPNYKMLTWLIVQLIIFSLFVFTVNIFKNNFIPYFNT